MSRSQRHNLENYNTTSAGNVVAQGQIAPSILAQNEVVTPGLNQVITIGPRPVGTLKSVGSGGWMVPDGPDGGPLQGSSMSGAIPAGAPPGPNPVPPDPDPLPGEEPVLNSINPNACAIGDDDLTLNVTGNRFTETSTIYFNNGPEETVFVNAGKVTTIVKPSLATVPVDVPVWVQQGSYQSNQKTFSFKELTARSSGERVLPMGPFAISRIDDHDDGISITLEDGDVRVGDAVLIEATGNTNVNGNYTVLAVDGLTIVVDNIIVLEPPIEAKGRLTINGEA
jgi:hypothetical protein